MSLTSQIVTLSARIAAECKALWAAVNGKASASHSHALADMADDAAHRTVTDTQIGDWNSREPGFTKNTAFNKNFGNAAGTVCQGNDSRLSDQRVPTDASVTYAKVAANLKNAATVTGTVDLSAAAIGRITLTANTAFSFTGFELNKTYLLVITANGYTPSWANAAKHVPVDGNASFATSGVYYVSLTCIDATAGSEKLLTMIMKGA